MRKLLTLWRLKRAARRAARDGRPLIAGGAFELPPVSRTIVVVIAILLLGLASVIVAIFNELIGWSRIGRAKVEQSGTATTSGAILPVFVATVRYWRPWR